MFVAQLGLGHFSTPVTVTGREILLFSSTLPSLMMLFDSFSTTLAVSPWQDHDLLREIGESVSGSTGIRFVYRDWRPLYRRSVGISRQLGLYRQPYCGCVMSERDRFLGKGSRTGCEGGP